MKEYLRQSLSLLTAFLMLICLLPFNVLASESTDMSEPENAGKYGTFNMRTIREKTEIRAVRTEKEIWDGSIAEGFAGGDGTAENPYLISNGSELAYLAQQVNGGESYGDTYFEMTSDIFLNDTENWEKWGAEADNGSIIAPVNEWTAIGYYFYKYDEETDEETEIVNPFNGNFNGGGFSVSGIYINKNSGDSYEDSFEGLFGYCACAISDLTVNKSYLCGDSEIGAIAGHVENGEITNCHNAAKITGDWQVGGLIGLIYDGSIDNCSNSGTIICKHQDAGGIAGWGEADIGNCINTGLIDCYDEDAGGITAWSDSEHTISDCLNTGDILCDYEWAGGIVGVSQNDCTVIRCYNKGNICGFGYLGGVAGVSYGTVQDCRNAGTITGKGEVLGGISGDSHNVISCLNVGDVIGGIRWIGGIAAINQDGTITDCYNTGNISGASKVGGIVGWLNWVSGAGVTANCYNIGNITAPELAGSIIGEITEQESLLGAVEHCYYLEGCCEQGDVWKMSAELTEEQLHAAESYDGFDFETVWTMEGNPDYPYAELHGNNHPGQDDIPVPPVPPVPPENVLGYYFESDPAGIWTWRDEDGNDYNWAWMTYTGNEDLTNQNEDINIPEGIGCMHSNSFLNGVGPLAPDNWLISPIIAGADSVSFKMTAQGSAYREEHIGIYVTTDGGRTWSDEIAGFMPRYSVTTFTVDLSAFTGQQIQVAFRHDTDPDQYAVNIDAVEFENGEFVASAPVCVTFKDSYTGEQIGSEITVSAGTALNESAFPAPPIHEGTEFIGWDYGGEPVDFDTVIRAEYNDPNAAYINGYIAFDPPHREHIWGRFAEYDAGYIEPRSAVEPIGAAAFAGGKVYGFMFITDEADKLTDSRFYIMDAETFEVTYPGYEAERQVLAMAYDHVGGSMYALALNDNGSVAIYTVNLGIGLMEYVADVNADGEMIGTLAIDDKGNAYGLNLSEEDAGLYCIDMKTGECTLIGQTGLPLNYAQSITWDYNTGKLFWAQYYDETQNSLYIVNPSTAQVTDCGNIGSNAEVVGLWTANDEPVAPITIPDFQITFTDAFTGGEIPGSYAVQGGSVLNETDFPAPPNHETDGLQFIGWDYKGTRIFADTEVTAKYYDIHSVMLNGYIQKNDGVLTNCWGKFAEYEPQIIDKGTEMPRVQAAAYVEGKVFGFLYEERELGQLIDIGQFFVMDAETCQIEFTGAETEKYVSAMAYDFANGIMYALAREYLEADDTALYTVDIKSGALKYVADIDAEGKTMFTLAIDGEGNAYGLSEAIRKSKLWSIDLATGICTLIGSTGHGLWYLQSMTWDHTYNRLFWAHKGLLDGSSLLIINPETAEVTDLGKLGDDAIVSGLWISNASTAPAPEPSGDYDCDSDADAEDVILTLRAAMELITPSEQALINADMDGDGRLTAADALTILRIVMKLL